MPEIEFDISFDYRSKKHQVFVDLGEETVTLTREDLAAMLAALEEADASL